MTRYGIAEWFGADFLSLTPAERREMAAMATGQREQPRCPFRTIPCNKRGGVCSIQPYEERCRRIVARAGAPVIVCPTRFEQDGMLVRWLAEIVGFSTDTTMVAREVPFMRSTDTGKHAGKIDLIVASDGDAMQWFGLEIQAVYFSGRGMDSDFVELRSDTGLLPPFPIHARRPDWRSSSAKRLMPQLQVKGPTLRRWHSKIAVAVDRPFFESLGGPSSEPSRDLDSGDVVWLIPELRAGRLHRWHWEVLTLEASGDKLLAARTVNRRDFESILREKLRPLRGRNRHSNDDRPGNDAEASDDA